jgi:hypothetical protein
LTRPTLAAAVAEVFARWEGGKEAARLTEGPVRYLDMKIL